VRAAGVRGRTACSAIPSAREGARPGLSGLLPTLAQPLSRIDVWLCHRRYNIQHSSRASNGRRQLIAGCGGKPQHGSSTAQRSARRRHSGTDVRDIYAGSNKKTAARLPRGQVCSALLCMVLRSTVSVAPGSPVRPQRANMAAMTCLLAIMASLLFTLRSAAAPDGAYLVGTGARCNRLVATATTVCP